MRRVMDVYVSPAGEDLGRVLRGVQKNHSTTRKLPENVRVTVRGSAQAMQVSFRSFGLGLILSTLLVYLILVAQFKSFLDPLLILLAVPTGLTGVLLILFADRHDAERDVADGRDDDGGHRGVQQHPDRGIHPPVARGGPARCGRPWRWPAGCGCGRC